MDERETQAKQQIERAVRELGTLRRELDELHAEESSIKSEIKEVENECVPWEDAIAAAKRVLAEIAAEQNRQLHLPFFDND